jgi:GDP-L-fucose synthase
MQLDQQTYLDNTQTMLSHINVGTGVDVTIAELAQTIKKVVGFEGELLFDPAKPEGTPRKLLDVSRINNMGWQAKISLEDGLQDAYQWFLSNAAE